MILPPNLVIEYLIKYTSLEFKELKGYVISDLGSVDEYTKEKISALKCKIGIGTLEDMESSALFISTAEMANEISLKTLAIINVILENMLLNKSKPNSDIIISLMSRYIEVFTDNLMLDQEILEYINNNNK